VTENIIKMRSRCFGYDGNAVWLASLSCMPQLLTLTIDVGTGGAPLMLFNIAQDGSTSLLGRPLIYTEMCKSVGTTGDIYCTNWRHYLIGESSYTQMDSSMHIRFEAAETAFRFIKYMMGMPWWRTTLTQDNDFVVSPFIKLDART
jgi:HK97 family phage major capsid protein